MAKTIIITEGDYGIEFQVQFVDKELSNLDNCTIDIQIVNPSNELLQLSHGQIIDSANKIASFTIDSSLTSIVGLYKMYWSVIDEDSQVTAQEDVYYYVKKKYGGVE